LATLIKPDGTESVVLPQNSTDFRLDERYSLIGCEMVQMVYLADGRTMWLDEEAKLKPERPLPNLKATRLLAEAGGMPGDIVLGNVLVCVDGEVL